MSLLKNVFTSKKALREKIKQLEAKNKVLIFENDVLTERLKRAERVLHKVDRMAMAQARAKEKKRLGIQ